MKNEKVKFQLKCLMSVFLSKSLGNESLFKHS